ncbi:DsbA family oxidoreductase [Acidithrix ferrooxidans]|uniref:DSBA-like thioredoxin domain protein n=1 Tax=Acidithrix ferrooxidans TaxID=1280514 RepID=A0A0D8HDM0_9ACTN|nr:DsbA family protein [Acidithrix ferrooxidans]KJF15979.1 DSBA-like thioredoxin domain protein [Acidithrix ferrooxidans]
MKASEIERVEFFYDPMCPFAFATSLWMREVAHHYGFSIDFRFFSLEEINLEKDKKHPWERDWSFGFSLMKVAALAKKLDPKLADDFYFEVGSAIHLRGEPIHTLEAATRFAGKVGIDSELVLSSIHSQEAIDIVRKDHDFVREAHGAFGVPTITFNGDHTFFGPVVFPPPKGQKALDLLDMVCLFVSVDNLYELKKPRNASDDAELAQRLKPYLSARAWKSI